MFILASASPRRQELLQSMGCEFRVHVSHAEETMGDDLPPAELAMRNARAKALAVAGEFPQSPVLGADPVVALEHHIYGKPKDAEDAKAMLRSFAGKTHEVITGIAFVRQGQVFQSTETTEVIFGEMTEAEIAAYVATGEPMDKAGAYAIQGGAECFIRGIHGSWSNVVGLPLYAVRELAGKAGINLYGNHGKGSAVE